MGMRALTPGGQEGTRPPAPHPIKPPSIARMINKLDTWEHRKPRLKCAAPFPPSSGKSDLSDPGQEVGTLAYHCPVGTDGAGGDPSPTHPSCRWRGTWENKRRIDSHSFCSRHPPVCPGPCQGPTSVVPSMLGWRCRRTRQPPAQARAQRSGLPVIWAKALANSRSPETPHKLQTQHV